MSAPRAIWLRLTTCPCGCGESLRWYFRLEWSRGFGRGRWVVEESLPSSSWKMYTTGFWTRRAAERGADSLYRSSTTRIMRAKEMDKDGYQR